MNNDQRMMNNTNSRNDESWIDFDVRGNNILRDELTKIFDQNDREKTIPETMRDFDVWSVAAEVMFPRKEVNLKTLAPDWKQFLISLFPKKEFNFQALSAD